MSKRKTKKKKSNSKSTGENKVYVDNLQALRKHYPEIFDRVLHQTQEGVFSLIKSKTNLPSVMQNSTKLVLYDQEDPMRGVYRSLSELSLNNVRLALFMGIGLGYELIHFIKDVAKQVGTSYILAVEKDISLFKLALRTVDLRPIITNERVHLMVGESEEKIYPLLRKYVDEASRFLLFKATRPVYHISTFYLNKDYYLYFLKVFKEACAHQISHFGTDPEDSFIGLRHMILNLHEIISNPGINLLFNKFKNKPAVVVSTGPSLNKNKHLLKGIEDKAVIIAADSSLKILTEMDYQPHLVASLERVSGTATFFEGFDSEVVKDTYLAACPVVVPEVYQNYPGPRCIVYRDFDHFKWLETDKGILNIKLSAGNMAFKLAESLGCDPIILIGQDLAMDDEGMTHAEGAKDGARQQRIVNEKKVYVKGNNGKKLLSNPTWYSFLRAYELDLANYSGKCINATEGGAYIEGTEIGTFQEAIDKYMKKEFNPLQKIKQELSSFSEEQVEEDYRRIKEIAIKTNKDLKSIIFYVEEGYSKVVENEKKIEGIIKTGEVEDGFDLSQLYQDIFRLKMLTSRGECQKSFQLFVMHVAQSICISTEMEIVGYWDREFINEKAVQAAIILRHKEWFDKIRYWTKVCKELLDEFIVSLDKKESEVNYV